MNDKVFINASVFLDTDSGNSLISNRNIDGIGRMCIMGIEELYKKTGSFPKDVPVFFGSAYGSLSSLHQFNRVSESCGPLAVNPSLFPNTVLNAPFCVASIYHHIKSPIFNFSLGNYSALAALEMAYNHLIHSEMRQAIVCAAENTCDFISHIEQQNLINCCGALYLSVEKSGWEITGFPKGYGALADESMRNSYGCTDILRRIHLLMENESKSADSCHSPIKENSLILRNGEKTIYLDIDNGQ